MLNYKIEVSFDFSQWMIGINWYPDIGVNYFIGPVRIGVQQIGGE